MAATAATRNRSTRVRIIANRLSLFIIVSVEKNEFAWGGSRWVEITSDGVAAGDAKPVSFLTLQTATAYAENQGFQAEPG